MPALMPTLMMDVSEARRSRHDDALSPCQISACAPVPGNDDRDITNVLFPGRSAAIVAAVMRASKCPYKLQC